MKISTKGRYALRFMLDLATFGNDEYIPMKKISQRQDISLKYLEQIVSLFNKSGYLESVRGAQGGYRLAKDPSEYTVGDVLRITEGSLAPVACLSNVTNHCPRQEDCATLEFWSGLDRVINDYVDSVTLADLVEKQRSGKAPNFQI